MVVDVNEDDLDDVVCEDSDGFVSAAQSVIKGASLKFTRDWHVMNTKLVETIVLENILRAVNTRL